MIKIYDLLFEQDNTSLTSTTQSSPGSDANAIKKGVEDAIKPLMKTQERITSYLDNVSKGQKKSPPPVSPATSSTTGTIPTGPSTPAGMGTSTQAQTKDMKNFATVLTKNLTTNKVFVDTLASKIKNAENKNK